MSNRRGAIVGLALVVLVSSFPFAVVHASNETSAGDGLVITIAPRNGVAGDSSVAVSPVGTVYVFDAAAYDTAGNPVPFTQWGAVIDSADRTDPAYNSGYCGGSGSPTCVYATGGTQPASNVATFTLPVGAVNFHGDIPLNGVQVTFILHRDANGTEFPSAGGLPTGSYSIGANALVARGDFKDADQADQAWNPVFLLNGQPSGFVQPGNPLVNPGFELGYSDESVGAGVKVAFPGWYLHNYKPDLGTDPAAFPSYVQDATPASSHHISSSNGTSGSYVSIAYNTADDGKDLALVQDIGAPNGLQWVGQGVVSACWDMKAWDATSQMKSLTVAANVFKASGGSSVQPSNVDGATIATDYAWHHVCVDYGSALDGQALREFYLNFWRGSGFDGHSGYTPSAQLHIQIDNVQLANVALLPSTTATPAVGLRSDLTDGYSVFITPVGAGQGTAGFTQTLVGLAGAKSAYVYRVASRDYTQGYAKSVDVPHSPNVVFELLDQRDVSASPRISDVSGGKGGLWTASASNEYRFLEPDGSVSKDLLVVADPAAFNASATTGALGTVPWAFVQQTPDVTYTNVYGGSSEPSEGYYSPARNAMMGVSLADAMDYDATPLALTGQDGGLSMASSATVVLTCPAASAGSTCAASTNSNPTLAATWTSASRVLETVHLHLVAASNPKDVLGNATVTTPSGSASFTLLKAQLDHMQSTYSNTNVEVLADAGTFVEGATSQVLALDNVAPTAAFTFAPSTGITRLTNVAFADASHDVDGSIVGRQWSVKQPDGNVTGMGQKGPNAASVSYKPAQLGDYVVTLTVFDNGGESNTTTSTFHVVNVPPVASLKAPAFSPAGVVTFDASGSVDPDAALPAHAFNFSTDGVNFAPSPGGARYVASATADGPLTVYVQVIDAQGAVAFANATTTVDVEAPATSLALFPNLNDTEWFAGPVNYSIARSDVGPSGVASTFVTVDGKTTQVNGASGISGTIAGDGTHAISAYSVDAAGNVEASPVARVVNIDTTAPSVSFTNPEYNGPIGGVVKNGDPLTMDVAAVDHQAPVTEVDFFVSGGSFDGSAPACVDTDGSDGYSCTLDTTGWMPGVYALKAIGENAASLESSTSTVYVLVTPALPTS